MIRFAMLILKMTLFSIVVLVISQIPVGQQRICDHVRDVVQHHHVQAPVRWISDKFNFLEGHRAVHADQAAASHANGPEHSESDRGRLSGLLKQRGH